MTIEVLKEIFDVKLETSLELLYISGAIRLGSFTIHMDPYGIYAPMVLSCVSLERLDHHQRATEGATLQDFSLGQLSL